MKNAFKSRENELLKALYKNKQSLHIFQQRKATKTQEKLLTKASL